ncbi:MAG: hypothetical protein KJ052_10630 [Candidatus Hydrogenedentes bacterium]|nr:hypothetical protein [Candidatus Hydrogenedentota bacterium]
MRQLKHIRYASQRYTMSPEESAQWDRADDTERRELLGLLAERLTETSGEDEGCRCLFYHSNGTLVAKSVHHEPLFENT